MFETIRNKKRELFAVGLSAGLLASGAACSSGNGDKAKSETPAATTESTAPEAIFDTNVDVHLDLAEGWEIVDSDYLGTTEFYEGDYNESDMFMVTIEDPEGSRLSCTYIVPWANGAGPSLDCNFEAYNQPR